MNDDAFFHLRFGHEFLAGWSLRSPGSPTEFGNRGWIPTQWLPQVASAKAEELGGLATVSWMYGAAVVAYFTVLYFVTRRESPPLAASTVSLLALLASGPGLSARPQVFSYLLVVVFTAAWLGTLRDGRLRWWLIPLTWLWTMLHGMWIIGVVISLVGAVGVIADRPARWKLRLRPLLIPTASLAVALLTPVGPSVVREVLVVGSRGDYFAEWAPPDFTQAQTLLVAALLIPPLVVWLRKGSVPWTRILLLLLASGWAVYAVRTGPVAAAMAAPLTAHALALALPRRDISVRDKRIMAVGAVATLALLVLVAPGAKDAVSKRPTWESSALEALPVGTPLLNEWGWSGYLMWRYPDIQLVVSGYGDLFTTAELERNVDLRRVRAGWDKHVTDLDLQYALLDEESDLAYSLIEFEGWTVIEDGDGVQLLRAPGPISGPRG